MRQVVVERGHDLAAPSTAADVARQVFDALVSQTTVGFALLDADLRYVTLNERLAEINGLPVAAARQRHVARELELRQRLAGAEHVPERALGDGREVGQHIGDAPAQMIGHGQAVDLGQPLVERQVAQVGIQQGEAHPGLGHQGVEDLPRDVGAGGRRRGAAARRRRGGRGGRPRAVR